MEIEARQCADQALCIRMSGLFEDLRGGANLDDLALVQDGYAVADLSYGDEVVRDEKNGSPAAIADAAKELQDVLLGNQIECAGRSEEHTSELQPLRHL